jgi:hypothetical protein
LENLAQFAFDSDYGASQDPSVFAFAIDWGSSDAMVNNDLVQIDLSK